MSARAKTKVLIVDDSAIVRKIVDAHDGHIDVHTPAEGGTRFRVTLPVSGGHEWFGYFGEKGKEDGADSGSR
jgi:hypothetical protein